MTPVMILVAAVSKDGGIACASRAQTCVSISRSECAKSRDVHVWAGVGGLTFARIVALAEEEDHPSPVLKPVPNPRVGRAIHSKVHARKGHTGQGAKRQIEIADRRAHVLVSPCANGRGALSSVRASQRYAALAGTSTSATGTVLSDNTLVYFFARWECTIERNHTNPGCNHSANDVLEYQV